MQTATEKAAERRSHWNYKKIRRNAKARKAIFANATSCREYYSDDMQNVLKNVSKERIVQLCKEESEAELWYLGGGNYRLKMHLNWQVTFNSCAP